MLLGIGLILLQSSQVQTWIAKKLAEKLSRDIGARVEIKSVNIRFFDRASLNGFYVADLHKDTLLYLERMDVNLDDIFLDFTHFSFDKVRLQNGQFNVRQFKGEDDLNIQFLIDYINGPRGKKKTKKAPPEFFFWKMELDNIDFTYEYRDSVPDTISYFNPDHIRIQNITGTLNRFIVIDDSVSGELKNMQCYEQKGFIIKSMDSDFIVSYTMMDFSNLRINTPLSNFDGKLNLTYGKYKDLNDFIEKVQMRSSINKAFIHSRDISFFAPELVGLDKVFSIQGKVKGSVEHLTGKNIVLETGKKTRFEGDFTIDSLPETDTTQFYFKIKNLVTNAEDIEKIPQYPFYENQKIKLADEVKRLGDISFTGIMEGYLSNVKILGELKSSPGNIKTNLVIKKPEALSDYAFHADIETNEFDMGKVLITSPSFGKVKVKGFAKGSGLDIQKFNGEIQTNISSIQINGETYNGIDINLLAHKKIYDFTVVSSDSRIDLSMNGSVDQTKKINAYIIEANVKRLDVNILTKKSPDSSLIFSSHIDAAFSGNSIEELYGRSAWTDILLQSGNTDYSFSRLELVSDLTGNEKSISLRSDIADATINGKYQIKELGTGIKSIANHFLPSSFQFRQVEKITNNQDYSVDIDFKDTRVLTNLFFPQLSISPKSSFSLNLSSKNDVLTFTYDSPGGKFGQFRYENVQSKGSIKNDALDFTSSIGRFQVSDSLSIRQIKLTTQSIKDSAQMNISWASPSKKTSASADLNLKAIFRDKKAFLHFLPSNILIQDSLWYVNEENQIIIDTSVVTFNNVALLRQHEFIRINGAIGKRQQDQLEILLDNFNLKNLNPLLKEEDVELSGLTSGIITMSDLLHKPFFKSDLSFTGIKFNKDFLGDGKVSSKWIPAEDRVEMEGNLTTNQFPRLSFKGDYFPFKSDDNLDFLLNFSNFKITILENYLADIFSKINDGYADGIIHLTGTPKRPELDGNLNLKRVSMTVDILNTTYSFTHPIQISKNKIAAKGIPITDQNGNSATLDLDISHRFFNDFYFDVNLKSNLIQVLNTTEANNESFYGNGFVSGVFHAYGPVENIKMDITAKTTRGTKFYLPLYDAGEIAEQDFISFERSGGAEQTKSKIKSPRKSKGYELNFNLEITEDADVFLIFDPNTGDIIKGKGTANLRLEFSESGDFNVFGNYVISSGDYLFNMVVSKPFVLERGGTISFKGNPFDADIDLTAVYKVRTPLYSLVRNIDSSATVKRPIDVNATMYLSDKLMKPTIKFDIKLPNADENSINLLKSQINNEDELNRQVFALIMLGSFWPNKGGANEIASISSVGANASELISNQLNNLLGRFSEDFKLGVNYKQGNATTKDEVRLLWSTQLLEDRIMIDGNFGTTGANTGTAINNTSNLVGEFTIEAKMNDEGSLRIKVFNRSNQNLLIYNGVPYTQGLGVFFRRDFDVLSDLKKSRKNK